MVFTSLVWEFHTHSSQETGCGLCDSVYLLFLRSWGMSIFIGPKYRVGAGVVLSASALHPVLPHEPDRQNMDLKEGASLLDFQLPVT